jgi:hypothetical protein
MPRLTPQSVVAILREKEAEAARKKKEDSLELKRLAAYERRLNKFLVQLCIKAQEGEIGHSLAKSEQEFADDLRNYGYRICGKDPGSSCSDDQLSWAFDQDDDMPAARRKANFSTWPFHASLLGYISSVEGQRVLAWIDKEMQRQIETGIEPITFFINCKETAKEAPHESIGIMWEIVGSNFLSKSTCFLQPKLIAELLRARGFGVAVKLDVNPAWIEVRLNG